jgi:hypothetical protein
MAANKVSAGRTILVTGSNRSGSTWVGQVLAQAAKVRYVHEPFSPVIAREQFGMDLPRWFLNAEDWNEDTLELYIQRVLVPPLRDRKLQLSHWQLCKRAVSLLLQRHGGDRFGWDYVLKDPVAIFSAPWLATRFDLQVVVLIRHPASYVLSLLKDARHMHSFASIFDEQPRLKARFAPEEHRLIEEVVEIQSRGGLGSDMVFEAAALWRLFYAQVVLYQQSFPHWHFVLYEDLARDPMREFASLCRKLGLGFDKNVETAIRRTALEADPAKVDHSSHVKKFVAKENTDLWKSQLAEADRQRICDIVSSVSERFNPQLF